MDIELACFGGAPKARVPGQQGPLAGFRQGKGEGIRQGEASIDAGQLGGALQLCWF